MRTTGHFATAASLLLGATIALGACTSAPSGSPMPSGGASSDATATLEPGATPFETPAGSPAGTGSGATPIPTQGPVSTPRPVVTPNTSPAIAVFTVPAFVDCTDQAFLDSGTIHIAWSVVRATGVTLSIDGGGLYQAYAATTDAADVPFACTTAQHTYRLTTTGGTGTAATSTKTTKASAPAIVSFAIDGSANCPSHSGSIAIGVNWVIAYATGSTLYYGDTQGGATKVYGTYGGKSFSGQIPYDCTKTEQWFRLETSGGIGTAASAYRKTVY